MKAVKAWMSSWTFKNMQDSRWKAANAELSPTKRDRGQALFFIIPAEDVKLTEDELGTLKYLLCDKTLEDSESWPDVLRDWKHQAEALESRIADLERENLLLKLDKVKVKVYQHGYYFQWKLITRFNINCESSIHYFGATVQDAKRAARRFWKQFGVDVEFVE